MAKIQITAKEAIDEGWSKDKKYRATGADGERYFMRVSDIAKYEAKKAEIEGMRQAAARGMPLCRPLEFGVCAEGVYSIQSWIDGENAEDAVPALPDGAQYAYGLESGRILRKMHSIPAPPGRPDWEERFNRKMDKKIRQYIESPEKYEDGQVFIDYIDAHRCLLKGRPQSYQHGDYHIGNMMIGRDGRLYIIDFDRSDYGDPWEEFNRIVWCAEKAPPFASGMVDGYFDGRIPPAFWELLALYIASNTLGALCWAIPFGEKKIETMKEQAREVTSWYDGMKRTLPSWYIHKQ